MADGNTAAPAGGVGDAADFVGVETGGVEREVEVEVDVEVEPAGEVEDAGDLGVGVAVDIGGAADEVAAGFEGGGEHVLAAGIVEEAFLGEGAEFEVDGPGVVALEALQGADAGQADAGVDLDMGADAGGALQDGALEGAAGAGVDVVLGEVALGGGDGGDGVDSVPWHGQRSRMADLSRWMWVSTKPAQTRRLSASKAGASAANWPISAIRPWTMPMPTGSVRSGRRALRMTWSSMGTV